MLSRCLQQGLGCKSHASQLSLGVVRAIMAGVCVLEVFLFPDRKVDMLVLC